VIPDEPPTFRAEIYSPLLSSQEAQASTSRSPPSPFKSPGKRIIPSEESRIHPNPLPEGCVDLFVAESESSEEDSDGEVQGMNVWRKMKGRLKSDLNDFTANGRWM
jgi:hypothetical protein